MRDEKHSIEFLCKLIQKIVLRTEVGSTSNKVRLSVQDITSWAVTSFLLMYQTTEEIYLGP